MATTEFIAAIELGSSKITGVAGKKNSDGSMQVLAYAQEDSSTFIRKGVIFNLDKTAQSLTSIINRLEGELKNSIAKVYVGIGGQSLRTVRNVVSRDLEEEAIISEELVSAIGDENIAIGIRGDIVHNVLFIPTSASCPDYIPARVILREEDCRATARPSFFGEVD